MLAAVAVARAHGSYATAHAHGAEGIKAAIRAGVRSIEHASLIDDEGLRMAKAAGVWLVMDIYNGDWIEEVGTREGWPEEYLRKNRETTDLQREGFAKAVRLGVRIGFGTDAGVYPHGLNARQFAYMVRYGMTPLQAIRSATVEAAALIGHEPDIGALEAGQVCRHDRGGGRPAGGRAGAGERGGGDQGWGAVSVAPSAARAPTSAGRARRRGPWPRLRSARAAAGNVPRFRAAHPRPCGAA
jgi:hypothetical protein